MKFLYSSIFTILTLIFSNNLRSQPTFNMNDIGFQIGDVIDMDTCNYVDVSTMTGANVLWDFNDITFGDAVFTTEIIPLSSVESPFDFGDANMVRRLTLEDTEFFHYFSTIGNEVNYHGYFAEISGNYIGGIIDNSELVFSAPMTYGSTNADTYDGTITSFGSESPLSGESSYEIVGYGTLLLNDETYEDVLLMHLTKSQTTLISGFDSVTEDDIYMFFKAGYHMPLLSFNHTISTFGPLDPEEEFSGSILVQQTSVGLSEMKSTAFNVYPNPVINDEVMIQFSVPVNSVIEISLLDPMGRTIEIDYDLNSYDVNQPLRVDLPNYLAGGIYQLIILGEEVFGSQSVVIK